MEDERAFGKPRLVVNNPDRGRTPKLDPAESAGSASSGVSVSPASRAVPVGANDSGEPVLARVDEAAGPTEPTIGLQSRDWCHLTVHCEWNENTEWWVGQIFAGREVYRTGLFTNLAAAFAETISEFYRIVPSTKPS